jgi:osmotically-inducible protein OsmY
MRRLLCGTLLLFASMTMAQQQERPPYYPPFQSTPPASPAAQNAKQRTPPEMPAPRMLTSAEVAQQIQNKLDTEPILKASKLTVAVDDATVTLSGTVDNEQEHKISLRIAGSYAGKRDIVDHIKIRG